MPVLEGVVETAVYVDDLERAREFYEGTLMLDAMFEDERMRAYKVGRSGFLVFKRGASNKNTEMKIGNIPAHDSSGHAHMAFAIARDELGEWKKLLDEHGVEIEGRVQWPKGGESIYFRDPDGNLLELATPGLWENY
jgi:catechol 2,3-dioxygenase-like lactoylglutathione lyase family enzyme